MTSHLSQPTELPGFTWHCAPPKWGFDSEGLFIQPAAGTDFWQRTHYGFSSDNGHFLFTRLPVTSSSPPRFVRSRAINMIRPG